MVEKIVPRTFEVGKSYTSEKGRVYKVDDVKPGDDTLTSPYALLSNPTHGGGLRPILRDDYGNEYVQINIPRDVVHA